MCGIVGISGTVQTSEVLDRLQRLEYRGYDSAGIATDTGIYVRSVGDVDTLRKKTPSGGIAQAIAHTRWATHGQVTEKNAHPHANISHSIFAVHNGILDVDRTDLPEYAFSSETDSEFIVHYIDRNLSEYTMPEICQKFITEIKGTFAILILYQGAIYCLKRQSPLAIAQAGDAIYIASDIHAFSDVATSALFLEDDSYAIVDTSIHVYKDDRLCRPPAHVFSHHESTGKGDYAHYMQKEMEEQPETARALIDSCQDDAFREAARLIRNAGKTVLLGSGTSYHAAMIGEYLLQQCGIDAEAHIASEYTGTGDCCIALSQSGETMDLLQAVKHARESIAIVNVPHSTLYRQSDVAIELCAGQEIAVASTKSFTNQVIVMLRLAHLFGYEIDLPKIPGLIKETLKKDVSCEITGSCFVLGNGPFYSIAREIALKLKEIAYIHAEAIMSGELKHGPLALVEEGFPVISLAGSNTNQEVKARGATVIELPHTGIQDLIPAAIMGHLISYHAARLKDLPIDKPRNLAKSVTVT
ncbi:MAG: glutamine--fructose-6-phosphate transaminase (isomerizing) [Nanobdellota archaeon]